MTRDPRPSTLDPRLGTLDKKIDSPSTLDTRPSTLDPRPSTLDPRPSTLDPRPSTLDPRQKDRLSDVSPRFVASCVSAFKQISNAEKHEETSSRNGFQHIFREFSQPLKCLDEPI